MTSRHDAREHAAAIAEQICAELDDASEGMSRYARSLVARCLVEHVSYWHSIHSGTRNHTWDCNLWADPDNVVFGKNPTYDPCPQCMG